MKKMLMIIAMACIAGSVMASVDGADNAANYSGGWTNGSNGGYGFGAWTFWDTGDAPFLGDSAVDGRQTVGNPAFGLSACAASGSGDYIHAQRLLNGGALQAGWTFSMQMNFLWNGGNRGFDLYSDASYSTKILNIRTDGDPLVMDIMGGSTGIELNTNNYQKAVTLMFTQVDATTLNIRTIVDGSDTYNANQTVVGGIQGVDFYAGGSTDTGNASNYDMYFNNMTSLSALDEVKSFGKRAALRSASFLPKSTFSP